jgi:hypothetical protein
VEGRAEVAAALAALLLLPLTAGAQSPATGTVSTGGHAATRVVTFLAGAAAGLAAHEGSHVMFGVALDAHQELKAIHFGPFPFFAIAHRPDLSPRREFTVSAAGFWMQHATSEWIVTRRPALRNEQAPFAKGVLAFNVLNSVGYSVVAMARAGPSERDTRAVGDALGIDERWVGAMVLAPALFDSYRYFHPARRWAVWTSRAMKVGMVLAAIK